MASGTIDRNCAVDFHALTTDGVVRRDRHHHSRRRTPISTSRALVSGASIAGLSAAYWLACTGWEVTVVERAPTFRDGGQNVDVRGLGRDVVDLMGLEDQLREHHTTEEGTAFVDERGRSVAAFPAQGADGPTAEFEILRGDLARIVLEALPDGVRVRYGTSIQDVVEHQGGVTVTFESGEVDQADLLVVAEGVRSATREKVFGADVGVHELGLTTVYGTIERVPEDDRWWRWYVAEGSRHATLRPDNEGTLRATLAFMNGHDDVGGLSGTDLAAALRATFEGAGWQSERIVDGFERSTDVYADRLAQIRMPRWSSGHTVLTGDTAWCVTPVGGGGSSLALVGGYALAAFLSQGRNRDLALADYEAWLRPLVEEVQNLPPGVPRLVYPRTRAGVQALRVLLRAVASRPAQVVAAKLGASPGKGRTLPTLRTV